MPRRSPDAARERYLKGQRVEVIGAADYNGQRGIVAWTDYDGKPPRIGVWLDSQNMAGTDMPITFLPSEVVRYGPLEVA